MISNDVKMIIVRGLKDRILTLREKNSFWSRHLSLSESSSSHEIVYILFCFSLIIHTQIPHCSCDKHEMKIPKRRTVEAEVQEQISVEIETIRVQMQLLENELTISRMRAESAEEELRQLKATLRLSHSNLVPSQMDASTSTSPSIRSHEQAMPPLPPPPPPPPMPNFISNPTLPSSRSRSNSFSLNDAINEAQQKLQQNSCGNISKGATGRRNVYEISLDSTSILFSEI